MKVFPRTNGEADTSLAPPESCTEAVMLAHDFTVAPLVELVPPGSPTRRRSA